MNKLEILGFGLVVFLAGNTVANLYVILTYGQLLHQLIAICASVASIIWFCRRKITGLWHKERQI